MSSIEEKSKCTPFGSRYLVDADRVFDHNAWDNVEFTEERIQEAQSVIEQQKQHKVADDRREELLTKPSDQWDAFYSQHSDQFFYDRQWLLKEFEELNMDNYPEGSKVSVLEVGCAVGNTSLPLVQWDTHNRMELYSCDYSSVAIDLLKNNPKFDANRIKAFVWDITEEAPVDAPAAGSMDIVVAIYVLSAIEPEKFVQSIRNLASRLKPGGLLLYKDYGRFDLTQLRFKKNRLIDDNFYCRGDGTLVHFLSSDQLDEVLTSEGLEKVENFVDGRLIVNRAKQVKMYRQWLQAKYRKKSAE